MPVCIELCHFMIKDYPSELNMNSHSFRQPTPSPRRRRDRQIPNTRIKSPRRVYCSTHVSHTHDPRDLESLLQTLKNVDQDGAQTAICIIEDITRDWIQGLRKSEILKFPQDFFKDFGRLEFLVPEPQPWTRHEGDGSSWHAEGGYSTRGKPKTRLSYCRAHSQICELLQLSPL